MKKTSFWQYVAILFALLAATGAALGQSPGSIKENIQDQITHPENQQNFICQGERICGISDAPRFYAKRNYQPAWLSDPGDLSLAFSLVQAIKKAESHGLDSRAYHLAAMEAFLAGYPAFPHTAAQLAAMDRLFTDAFLMYGAHLAGGRVDPETVHTLWAASTPRVDLDLALEEAIRQNRVESVLENLAPPHGGYEKLRQALARYENLQRQGPFPLIAQGPVMERGSADKRTPVLRQRLARENFLDSSSLGGDLVFGVELDSAVREFQKSRGLAVDGQVGPRTLEALNVPVTALVALIRNNLERFRWIPRELGDHYIQVNIAGFQLAVVQDGEAVMEMPIVVGRPYRRTPVFSSKMTYLVLNPYWNVPRSIAVKDILPQVKKDPGYLSRGHLRVFESWAKNAAELDPETVDWERVTPENFAFKLRQDPGPDNALGRVKFMFPSQYAVYLHDTPSRHLFQKTRRSFSSGCIRVAEPMDLATHLMKTSPDWTGQALAAALEQGQNQVVSLPEPVEVHVLYQTAWVNEKGRAHFLNDVYGRDAPLKKALEEAAPKVR